MLDELQTRIASTSSMKPSAMAKLSPPLWVPKPKEEVLTDLLKELAGVLERLMDLGSLESSQEQRQSLKSFVEYILKPWNQSCKPSGYEEKFRASKNLHEREMPCVMSCVDC